jgi:hypothetical protein
LLRCNERPQARRRKRVAAIPRADTGLKIAWTALVLPWWIEWVVFPSAWLGVELRLSAAADLDEGGARRHAVVTAALVATDLVRLFRR